MRNAVIGTSTLFASAALIGGVAVSPALAAPAANVAPTAVKTAAAPTLEQSTAAARAKANSAKKVAAQRTKLAAQAKAEYLRLVALRTAAAKKAHTANNAGRQKAINQTRMYTSLADTARNTYVRVDAARARAVSAANNFESQARALEAKLKAAKAAEAARRALIAKFGTASLPVTLEEAARYNLSNSDIAAIAAAASWANTPKAQSVVACESGGNYGISTGNGYYGAWQFDYGSWLGNGGGRWSQTANGAPKWAQDLVAYNYWQNAGWGPWACA